MGILIPHPLGEKAEELVSLISRRQETTGDLTPVAPVGEARLELLFKKKGEALKVRILRKEPQGGEKEGEFEVTPQ